MNMFEVSSKCGNEEIIIFDNGELSSDCFNDFTNDQMISCNCCARLCLIGEQVQQKELPEAKEIIRALLFQIEEYITNKNICDIQGDYYSIASIKHKYLNEG